MHISELGGRTAVSYARWSSGRQSLGSSSARQTRIATEYAARAGMQLDYSIVDDGISAFSGGNLEAGLGKFLERLRSGEISPDIVLLIENMDRFSRMDPMDALPAFLSVLKTGLTIVTLQDEMIHSEARYRENSMLLIPSLVAMQLAHDESRKKSTRLKASWDDRVRKLQRGERIAISKVPFWIDRETQQLGSRSEDASEIFRLAAAGHGASAITRLINERGIPSSRGGTWGKSMVQDVLKSKEAFGTLVMKGHEQAGYFPPIVSEAVWMSIANRARGQQRNPQASTNANLFSRLLRCGCCDSPMNVTTTSSRGKRYRYASCDRKTTARNECDAPNWPYDALEDAFMKRLWAILTLTDPATALSEPGEADGLRIKMETLEAQKGRAITSSIAAEAEDVQTAYRQEADRLSREISTMRGRVAELAEREAVSTYADEQVQSVVQDMKEVQRLWKEDRSALKGMIANIVKSIHLERFHPKDFNLARVRLRNGKEHTLGFE